MNLVAKRLLTSAVVLGITFANSGTAHATELTPNLAISGSATLLDQPWGVTSRSDGKNLCRRS